MLFWMLYFISDQAELPGPAGIQESLTYPLIKESVEGRISGLPTVCPVTPVSVNSQIPLAPETINSVTTNLQSHFVNSSVFSAYRREENAHSQDAVVRPNGSFMNHVSLASTATVKMPEQSSSLPVANGITQFSPREASSQITHKEPNEFVQENYKEHNRHSSNEHIFHGNDSSLFSAGNTPVDFLTNFYNRVKVFKTNFKEDIATVVSSYKPMVDSASHTPQHESPSLEDQCAKGLSSLDMKSLHLGN